MKPIRALRMRGPAAGGGVAYRYYRINMSAPAIAGQILAFGEIQGFETSGGANIFLSGTATSSTDGFGWTPDHAINNDTTGSEGWHAATNALPQWLLIDLGAGVSKGLHSYRIFTRAGREDQAPGSWTLEGSHDASVFDVLDTQAGLIDTTWQAGGGSPSRLLFLI